MYVLDTQQSKEVDLFTSGRGRVEYLQAAYSYLRTILLIARDVFQRHRVDYKIRSDDMFYALIFLQNYLKQ